MKDSLKKLALTVLGQESTQTLRRYYLPTQVLRDRIPHEREHELLQAMIMSGDTVIDAGANIGVYTRALAERVGATGRVYAFEPLEENLSILRRVVQRGGYAQVELFDLALGARNETREMVIPDLGGFTGLYWAHFANPSDSGRRCAVKVISLDEFARQRRPDRLQFIKCDVEGAEREILRGGAGTIQQFRPGWLMEVTRTTSDEIFQMMHAWGYRAFVYASSLRETAGYRDGEASNYFFIHPDSIVWQRLSDAGQV
jgi:FkbM family methyltransferase